jgi:hypothetical protein
VGDVSGSSSRGIFLSYRREDTGPYARLLEYKLRERLPDAHVFMDLDSVAPAQDFTEVIRAALDSCAVLVALIGRQWVTIADEEGRRLDDADDWVRIEVKTALERAVLVIPVLVEGARPLRQQQLPAELHKLARLNALVLDYGRHYEDDAGLLINLIQGELAKTIVETESSVGGKVRDRAVRYNTLREKMPSSNQRTVLMADIVRELRNLLKEVPDFDVARYLSDADRGLRLAAYAYLMEHKAPEYRSQLVKVACAEDKPFGQYTGLEAILYQGQTAERLRDDDLSILSSLAQRLGPGEDRTQLINDIIALERSKP